MTRQVYIDSSASPGGDGSVSSPYNTTAAWQTDEATDLTAATGSNENHIADITGTFTAALNVDGWSTEAGNDILLNGSGIASCSITAATSYAGVLQTTEDYVTFFGCYVENTASAANNCKGISFTAAATVNSKCVVDSCQARMSGTGTASSYTTGIAATAGLSIYLVNNSISGNMANGIYYDWNGNANNVILYNNTIYGADTYGIYSGASGACSHYVYNNLCIGNGTDFYLSAVDASGGNASSDTSSPQTSLRSLTISFTDAANGDLHTQDSDIVGCGTDLSADSYYPFNYDIDGDTRVSWEAGADAYTPGANNLFYDFFNRADEVLDTSSDWTARATGGTYSYEVVSNVVELVTNTTYHVSYYIDSSLITDSDYSVQADLEHPSTAGISWFGVFGRGIDYGTGDTDCYIAFNKGSYLDLYLFRRVSGSWNQLDWASNILSNDTYYTVKLIMNGYTISVEVDGTEQATYTGDAANDWLTSGYAGICNGTGGSGTGDHIDNFSVDSLSTGISQAVNQATETDTAQAITSSKVKAIGQATETDTAQPITQQTAIQQPVNQATETDTAQAVTPAKSKAISQPVETDTAQAVTPAKSKALGQVVEADTAQAFTHSKVKALGQATETDTAQPISTSLNKIIPVNQATESDTAQALTSSKVMVIGQAVEAETAQPITVSKALQVGQVVEADTAQALTRGKLYSVAQVIETDTAQSITPSGGAAPSASSVVISEAQQMISSRTETAFPINISVSENGNGAAGLTVQLAIRNASDSSSYLDFNDMTFKASGWTTQNETATEIGGGMYTYVLDIASITNLPSTDHLVVEYEVSGSVTGIGSVILSLTDRPDVVDLIRKFLQNRSVTNVNTGVMQVFDDDDITVLAEADVWKDADGTQPYDGTAINRRDRLE